MAIVIVGGGGFAGVAAGYLRETSAQFGETLGYLAPAPSFLATLSQIKYLGCEDDYAFEDVSGAIVAIGEPTLRRKITDKLLVRGVPLPTLVHPRAYVADSAMLGAGCILAPLSFVEAGATVGRSVVLTQHASVGHDSLIGNFCQFSPFSGVMGACRLGSEVFLGTGALVAPGVSVGARSKLSAGAIVMRSCEAGSLMVGNPAKGRVMFR